MATEPKLPEKLINSTLNYSYNTAKNRLTSSQLNGTNTSYTYDSEGQLKTQGATSYTFDPAHRLTAQGASSYTYDGVGNRIKATRNGVTTKYIYDAAGNLLAEANASNVITRYYIYGLGLTALVDAATNALYVYHHDGTGHTVALTNAAQQTANTYAYDPYGRVMAKTETVAQPFQYAGQVGVFAEGNNFYYMRARYYDASVGRFISEDPIGFAGGLNLYAYVGGNPVMLVDPSGLEAEHTNPNMPRMGKPSFFDAWSHKVFGNGEPMYVEVDKLDFGNLKTSDFDANGRLSGYSMRSANDYLVHGQESLILLNGAVAIEHGYSVYDFEFHPNNSIKNVVRNIGTAMGSAVHLGPIGKGYTMYFVGSKKLAQ